MNDFMTVLNGTLYSALSWAQWDALLQTLRATKQDGWYVYYVGTEIPDKKLVGEEFEHIITEIDALLRRDHDEEYLGIVYMDDFTTPSLVKIYDPNNLGSSCGSCGFFVPPGWIISKMQPAAIHNPQLIPQGRKRWWGGLVTWLHGQSQPT